MICKYTTNGCVVVVEAVTEEQSAIGTPDQPGPEGGVAPDYKELYLRALADLDNYRKGLEKQRVAYVKSIADSVMRRLLEPVDSVDRAIADLARLQAEAPPELQAGIGRSLEGVKGLQRQLADLLAAEGVTIIDAGGAEFDPGLHEALVRVPHPTIPADHIVEVLRPGYQSHGRLLRPAAVSISAGPPKNLGQGEQAGADAASPAKQGARNPGEQAHPQARKKGAHENHPT